MRIDCLETPALLVDRDALDRNMERMRLILEKSGVALRPHYKSHKSQGQRSGGPGHGGR